MQDDAPKFSDWISLLDKRLIDSCVGRVERITKESSGVYVIEIERVKPVYTLSLYMQKEPYFDVYEFIVYDLHVKGNIYISLITPYYNVVSHDFSDEYYTLFRWTCYINRTRTHDQKIISSDSNFLGENNYEQKLENTVDSTASA